MMTFADLQTARAARGLRLVVLDGLPSPWSEAAKGTFDIKGLDYLAVRLRPGDADTRAWAGHHNAPVALLDDEPPRAAWSEILMLAERLAPEKPLLPATPGERTQALHLGQEILGEGGLMWCARLLLIHLGLTTEGQRGFPVRAAGYLAQKYGYAPDRIAAAHARVLGILEMLATRLRDGRRGFFGDAPTSVDVQSAAALGVLAPLSESDCPTLPAFRRAWETFDDDVRAAVSPELRAHRDWMYEQHLPLPVRL